jgi:general stress protein CsbA
MPSTVPFWIAFVVTVVLMVAALVTGWTRRRRLHLWLGPLTMVALTITIVLTEELVRRYEFPAQVLRTHLWFAKAGGLLALPVIATGVWLWRRPRARVWHRIAVLVWLVSVLCATGTGLWMFAQGTPKPG